jgi:hypothetical protein
VESTLCERDWDAWTGGAEYYRRNLAGDVLMAFPGTVLWQVERSEVILIQPRTTGTAQAVLRPDVSR